MPERRNLDLTDFDQLEQELHRLRDAPYDHLGQWTLAQNCEHCERLMVWSMDGFPFGLPWHMLPLRLVAPALLRKALRERRIPTGQGTLKPFIPDDMADPAADGESVDRWLATLERYRGWTQPLHASPFFGKLDRATWDELQLLHASHHLSFIVPRGEA